MKRTAKRRKKHSREKQRYKEHKKHQKKDKKKFSADVVTKGPPLAPAAELWRLCADEAQRTLRKQQAIRTAALDAYYKRISDAGLHTFDWRTYLAANDDVRRSGNFPPVDKIPDDSVVARIAADAAVQHWMRFGCRENRMLTIPARWRGTASGTDIVAAYYPELRGASAAAVLQQVGGYFGELMTSPMECRETTWSETSIPPSFCATMCHLPATTAVVDVVVVALVHVASWETWTDTVCGILNNTVATFGSERCSVCVTWEDAAGVRTSAAVARQRILGAVSCAQVLGRAASDNDAALFVTQCALASAAGVLDATTAGSNTVVLRLHTGTANKPVAGTVLGELCHPLAQRVIVGAMRQPLCDAVGVAAAVIAAQSDIAGSMGASKKEKRRTDAPCEPSPRVRAHRRSWSSVRTQRRHASDLVAPLPFGRQQPTWPQWNVFWMRGDSACRVAAMAADDALSDNVTSWETVLRSACYSPDPLGALAVCTGYDVAAQITADVSRRISTGEIAVSDETLAVVAVHVSEHEAIGGCAVATTAVDGASAPRGHISNDINADHMICSGSKMHGGTAKTACTSVPLMVADDVLRLVEEALQYFDRVCVVISHDEQRFCAVSALDAAGVADLNAARLVALKRGLMLLLASKTSSESQHVEYLARLDASLDVMSVANTGRDITKYEIGLRGTGERQPLCRRVLLVNDTIVPVRPLSHCLQKMGMRRRDGDGSDGSGGTAAHLSGWTFSGNSSPGPNAWSLSDCYNVTALANKGPDTPPRHHIGSCFLLLDPVAQAVTYEYLRLTHAVRTHPGQTRTEERAVAVHVGEVGLSRHLLECGLDIDALYAMSDLVKTRSNSATLRLALHELPCFSSLDFPVRWRFTRMTATPPHTGSERGRVADSHCQRSKLLEQLPLPRRRHASSPSVTSTRPGVVCVVRVRGIATDCVTDDMRSLYGWLVRQVRKDARIHSVHIAIQNTDDATTTSTDLSPGWIPTAVQEFCNCADIPVVARVVPSWYACLVSWHAVACDVSADAASCRAAVLVDASALASADAADLVATAAMMAANEVVLASGWCLLGRGALGLFNDYMSATRHRAADDSRRGQYGLSVLEHNLDFANFCRNQAVV